MVVYLTAFEAALCAFKVGCIFAHCRGWCGVVRRVGVRGVRGVRGVVRNLAHREKMRHNVVLSFFCFWNLKIRPKIFQKSGTDFRQREQVQPTPIFFTGRKILRPIAYELRAMPQLLEHRLDDSV